MLIKDLLKEFTFDLQIKNTQSGQLKPTITNGLRVLTFQHDSKSCSVRSVGSTQTIGIY